jgi:two-component sensor histidine kinase
LSPRLGGSRVQGFAGGEAGPRLVPESDRILFQLITKVYLLAFSLAGEVDETALDVLDDDPRLVEPGELTGNYAGRLRAGPRLPVGTISRRERSDMFVVACKLGEPIAQPEKTLADLGKRGVGALNCIKGTLAFGLHFPRDTIGDARTETLMPSLTDLVKRRTDLKPSDVEQIHRLLESWQLIADLSFADLLLWCRLADEDGFVCVAQMRPHTAQTVHPEDPFGNIIRPEELPVIDRAFLEGRSWTQEDPLLIDGVQVRMEAIPLPFDGRVIAVMTREGAPLFHRRPGRLEETYLECARYLDSMVENGLFPFADEGLDPELSSRVGDGLIRLDAEGSVLYASPNAMSAYRRLGIMTSVIGQNINDLDIDMSPATRALSAGRPSQGEVSTGDRIVLHQAIPFITSENGRADGAMLLVRDVTELRHRELMIERKDAHIREIHHRVKNNLQTIASLLRVQARRIRSKTAKEELAEAVRRINSIAVVHETLTREVGESVDLKEVMLELVALVRKGLINPETRIELDIEGDPGRLPAELATPLAVVVVELLQNSVEHALERGGEVSVGIARRESMISLVVQDNGRGLPEGFGPDDEGLGLQIVRALVTEQLGGTLSLHSDGGTRVALEFPFKSKPLLRPGDS